MERNDGVRRTRFPEIERGPRMASSLIDGGIPVNASNLLSSLSTLLALSGALTACAEDPGKRALFVVSNISDIPAPGGGERASGVWLSEVTHPYWVLRDAAALGFTIDLASPHGGAAAIDGFSVKLNLDDFLRTGVPDSGDPLNERFRADPETRDLIQVEDVPQADGTVQQRHAFRDTLALADVRAADYDVVFYAGGNAAPFEFVDDERVHGAAREVYEAGGLVTAVCHGTSALLETKLAGGQHLVAGRRVTGFSNAEEDALGQRAVMPVLLEEEFPRRGASYTAAAPFTAHVVVDGRLITGQQPASGHAVGQAIVTYFAE
jgi:putative intracellular protease/amidase